MDILKLIATYQELGIAHVQDHEKFNLIAIDHHSTRIEGSTLTLIETELLITEGLTPKGKPLTDSLMVTDHHEALQYVLQQAGAKAVITVELIREINARVMKHTGKTYSTLSGTIDAATGAFRKGNVVAGLSYFPNFDKVERLTTELTRTLNLSMSNPLTREQQLNLSFDAHFNLLSIHPYYDGNGRTSRLLMNLIQSAYNLPLAIIYSDTKADYYEALVKTRENNDTGIFREFMYRQYERQLSDEIRRFREMNNPQKGSGFTLLF